MPLLQTFGAEQLLPGALFGWLTYSQMFVVALQVPVLHVCTGQVPQLTVWPQLLVTLPHLPVQVCCCVCGVQQPLPVQTCPEVQQTLPLQQVCPAPVQFGPCWPLVTGV